jgi:predicted kinase
MAERAKAALIAGSSVIADAVYARPGDRETIARIAADTRVPFIGLWIDGPEETLARRLGERVGDASDATADVLALQMRAGVGPLDWHRLDGSRNVSDVQRSAESRLMAFKPPLS